MDCACAYVAKTCIKLCACAENQPPHSIFFWNIIPTTRQSTYSHSPRPNRVIWQPPASPNAPILTPHHIYVRGGGSWWSFFLSTQPAARKLIFCKKKSFTAAQPPHSKITPYTSCPHSIYTYGEHAAQGDRTQQSNRGGGARAQSMMTMTMT